MFIYIILGKIRAALFKELISPTSESPLGRIEPIWGLKTDKSLYTCVPIAWQALSTSTPQPQWPHIHLKIGIGTKGRTNATNAFQCWYLLLDARAASYASLKQIQSTKTMHFQIPM